MYRCNAWSRGELVMTRTAGARTLPKKSVINLRKIKKAKTSKWKLISPSHNLIDEYNNYLEVSCGETEVCRRATYFLQFIIGPPIVGIRKLVTHDSHHHHQLYAKPRRPYSIAVHSPCRLVLDRLSAWVGSVLSVASKVNLSRTWNRICWGRWPQVSHS